MADLPLCLVVDDEPFVGRVVRLLLDDARLARVRVATSAEEMWQALAEERPALVLLDVLLPDAHGLALLARLRDMAEYKDLPVLVLTGVPGMEGSANGLELADGMLAKPAAPRLLARVCGPFLRAACGRSHAEPNTMLDDEGS